MLSNSFLSHISGHDAELQAKEYLEAQGLCLVEQNYKAKVGEIDLIMMDAEQWVFVEVKFRNKASHGHAAEFVTRAKLAKVRKAVMHFFMAKNMNIHHTALRIDVVAIDDQQVNWIKNV